jgi:hypothetical protein
MQEKNVKNRALCDGLKVCGMEMYTKWPYMDHLQGK